MRLINTLILMLLTLYCAEVACEEENKISTHGFIAQGLIQADGSNFVNDEGDVSASLTEMGLNAAYRFSPGFRIAGQVVYLNGGNRYPEGARLDYLFVDWELVNNFEWQLNMHLGRYKNYHWLYSATRDVPHTRPSIVLPQSIYFDTFRDVALGSDGVALIAQTNTSLGDWEVHWSYGTSPISQEQTRNLLSSSAQGELDQDFTHQLTFVLRPEMSNMHLGLSLLDSDFTYIPTHSDVFVPGEATVQRMLLQFKYLDENWDVSAELMREKVIYRGVLAPQFFNSSIAEGGFVQGRYHLNPDISLLARLDIFDRDREDRAGRNIELATGGVVPGYFGFSDQATIGAHWDIKQNLRLQVEYHRVKGTGRLAPVLSPNLQFNKQKYWNIWAIQLMHWF